MTMPGHHRVTGSGEGRPAAAGQTSPAGGNGGALDDGRHQPRQAGWKYDEQEAIHQA